MFFVVLPALFSWAIFVSIGTYPHGPICICMLVMVLLIVAAKRLVFEKGSNQREYVSMLSIPLLLCGAGVFIWWVVWTNQGPKGYSIWSPSVDDEYVDWSMDTKRHYARRINCEPEDDVLLDDVEDP